MKLLTMNKQKKELGFENKNNKFLKNFFKKTPIYKYDDLIKHKNIFKEYILNYSSEISKINGKSIEENIIENFSLALYYLQHQNKAGGLCYFNSIFTNVFFKDVFNINIKPILGIVNNSPYVADHCWSEYNSKKIDLSLHFPLFSNITERGQYIVLDEIKNNGKKYIFKDYDHKINLQDREENVDAHSILLNYTYQKGLKYLKEGPNNMIDSYASVICNNMLFILNSIQSNKEQLNIVNNVSKKIANIIYENNFDGECHFVSKYLKYYLNKNYDINISIENGIINDGGIFHHHSWNSFNNKKIDITIHRQRIKDIETNPIILNDYYIINKENNNKSVYMDKNNLTAEYNSYVKLLTHEEIRLKNLSNKTEEDNYRLNSIKIFLDRDVLLSKEKGSKYKKIDEDNFEKNNMNKILKWNTLIINY